MKKLVFILLTTSASFAATGSWNGVAFTGWNGIAQTAWNGTGISCASGGASYLVNQGFEGTGYDNSETWTESGVGTIDEDYATNPGVGSQSLRIVASAQAANAFVSFTAQDQARFFCRFLWVSKAAANIPIVVIRNGTTTIASVSLLATGDKIRVSAQGGSNNDSTDAVPVNTWIYLWVEYDKGTGVNAVCRAGWSTDGTKPTFSSGAAKACVSSNGTSTSQADRLYLGNVASYTAETVWDHVLASASTIGNNP